MTRPQRIQRLVEPNYRIYKGTKPQYTGKQLRRAVRRADWKQTAALWLMVGAVTVLFFWAYFINGV